jgi:Tripartite tricarboxylate transporter family receptor
MNPLRRRFLQLAAAAAALRAVSSPVLAQPYPARPVRVIVPIAPGGQVDVISRLFAQKLSERLGKQFYVENLPGAGGTIGTSRAAMAAPDGYTLLGTDGIFFVTAPNLYNRVPYDPSSDFEAVAIAATTAQMLAVHPSVSARTVKELVALIKAGPGKYSYASAGVGTGAHLTGELFRVSLGLDIRRRPCNRCNCRRPYSDCFRLTSSDHPTRFGWQAARIGGRRQESGARTAGRPHHGRRGVCEPRVRHLGWVCCTGQDTNGNSGAPQSGDCSHRSAERCDGPDACAWVRVGVLHTSTNAGLHQKR